MASKEQENKKILDKKNRGTKDEFEAIASILLENQGLKRRVLEIIRRSKSPKGSPRAQGGGAKPES